MSESMAYVWKKTGEHRPPLAGEQFIGYKGYPETARFDFSEQSFDILRAETVPAASVAHEGDPCIHCGVGHGDEAMMPGPCRGLVFVGAFLDEEEGPPLPVDEECDDSWYSIFIEDYEVIGNIYQNPKLLEGRPE